MGKDLVTAYYNVDYEKNPKVIQGTTSIAEKTVRPLMSATTVVSATAVVACSIKNV